MDRTTLIQLLDGLSSLPFYLLLLMPVIFVIFKLFTTKTEHLPPGPRPWPIIGNMLQLGKMPHVSLTSFAKEHGPLISLRLGTRLLVVGSSPRVATEILKTNDRLLSGRYVLQAIPVEHRVLDRIAIIWASECNEGWKSLRALCRTELFSAKAIESQAVLREKKVMEMVEFLRTREGKVVKVGEVVFATVFNTMGNLLFSRDFVDYGDGGESSRLKGIVRRMIELGASPNICDFYSVFSGLDPQGLKKKISDCIKEMFSTWEIFVKERRETERFHAHKSDFLDVFLANGFDDEQINWLLLELFTAGADTTSTTVEWAMAELIKNKQVMKRVRQELEEEQINGNALKESQISQLPYLSACVKETLRLHPPAPLLLPHRAIEDCKVMNYEIPRDTQLFVNVWAIGRDPHAWGEDPLSFRPERFLGSTDLDFKGQNYEFLPFGAGRRICPGLPMAAKQVQLILACMIRSFDWSLPNGEDHSKLDMSEKFGVTLQKEQPLLLVPN
ncbi:hypothetical protein K2173_008695 [Erythroxylum novogranatense]|uniref:(S)-N-methylcoclaurine 3'-hydroxylase isozyme 2 n=1 Tax=Erythroxylum novogranatense TaxID=1862640 RepID=A0AAV8SLN2_9ROSI|nr:hypothetical protein K2173_008695 [Erythroxylum novogranatense]